MALVFSDGRDSDGNAASDLRVDAALNHLMSGGFPQYVDALELLSDPEVRDAAILACEGGSAS